MRLRCPAQYDAAAKQIPGVKRNRESGAWDYPLSKHCLQKLRESIPRLAVSPKIINVLDAEDKRIKEAMEIKSGKVPELEYDWATEPYDHQVLGVAWVLKMWGIGNTEINSVRGALLTDTMGLGKSKQSIDACLYAYQRGAFQRVLVICPASLKYNFAKEIEIHSGGIARSVVIDGGKKKRLCQLETRYPDSLTFYIINYESLRLHIPELQEIVNSQCLIADEAHRVKDINSQVTKALYFLQPAYTLLMTGTPTPRGPEDVFSLAHYVKPGILGKSYWSFVDRYCVTERVHAARDKRARQIVNYKNMDELTHRLDTISLRRLDTEVLNLPEQTFYDYDLEMADEQKRCYSEMQNYLYTYFKDKTNEEIQSEAANAFSQLLRLSQITGGVLAGTEGAAWIPGNAKAKYLQDLLNGEFRGEKVVIMCRFVKEILELYKLFPERRPVLIYGDVKPEDRQMAVNMFQSDPDYTLFIGQINTAGFGLTLTAARKMIFYSKDFSWGVVSQAEKRIHRIGQTGTCCYINLLARYNGKETIDHHIAKVLARKKALSDEVTGDAARLVLTKNEIMEVLS